MAGISTGQQADWVWGDVTLFWDGGKRLTVGIQAVPSLLASGPESSLQSVLVTDVDLTTVASTIWRHCQ